MSLCNIRLFSRTLRLSVGVTVLLPDLPEAWETPPSVLYLLHGLSGDHTGWVRNTSIERRVRDYPLVVVMPEVHRSFYCDMTHGLDYATFVAEELPAVIGRWLRVSTAPGKTFIAGASMGGYGAVRLALLHPEKYAAVAAFSGVFDLPAHFNDDFDERERRSFEAVFGDLHRLPGSDFDLPALLRRRPVPSARFLLRVGTEDERFLADSRVFRDAALARGLDLTYQEVPGDHSWDFWDRSLPAFLEWLPIDSFSDEAGPRRNG